MAPFTILYATLLLWGTCMADFVPLQLPPELPVHARSTSRGCFASLPSDAGPGFIMTFNVPATCSKHCAMRGKPVGIVHADLCFCAESYPPRSSMLPGDRCDIACPGYDRLACGGDGAYGVFNVGIEIAVAFDDEEKATSTESEVGSEESTSVESKVGDEEESTSVEGDVSDDDWEFVSVEKEAEDDEEKSTSGKSQVGDEDEFVWVEKEVDDEAVDEITKEDEVDDEAVDEITKEDETLLNKVGDFFNKCIGRLGWGHNKDLK